MLEDPPCLVTGFVEGEQMTRGGAARAGGAGRGRRGAARRPRLRRRAAGALRLASGSSRTTPTTARERGAELPGGLRVAHAPRAADRGGAERRRARPGASATTTCSPPTSSARRTGSGSSTGSTRAWATATSTSATSPSTTSSTTARRRRCSTPTSASRPTPARLAALRLMRLHVRLPRGDVGGGPEHDLRPRLRLRRLRREALRPDAEPPPTRLRGLAGEARCRGLSCPTAPAA